MTRKSTSTSTKSTTRKGVGYIRVSRQGGREGESFRSPELQRERINDIAKASGVKIVRWYTDIDESGGKWDRPGFQSTLDDIDEHVASVVVVARMSRFGRSALDVHRAVERMEQSGGALIAGDLNIDTTTPNGKLMRGILTLIAEWELEVASEQWKDAKAAAVESGVYIAKMPPTGYLFDDDHRLTPDPETSHLIPQMYDRRASGESWGSISQWWAGETGRWLDRQSFHHIVKNRAYLGEVRYGKNGDALVNESAHTPLVTIEQWEAAQSKTSVRPARKGEGQLLSSLMTCASCGRKMTATTSSRGKLLYKCKGLSASGKCPAPVSVQGDQADPYIEASFLAWATVELEGVSDEREQMETARAAADAARAELVAFVTATSASANPDLFAAALLQREQAVEDADAEVERVRQSSIVDDLVLSVQSDWPNMRTSERRQLLASAIDSIVVTRGPSQGSRVPFDARVAISWRAAA
jgi:DNA invertase Pin-like site-specific DNA recombinase